MKGHSFLDSILTWSYGAPILYISLLYIYISYHIIGYFWTISYEISELTKNKGKGLEHPLALKMVTN